MAFLAAVGLFLGTLAGNFVAEQHHPPVAASAAHNTDAVMTIASLKAFDAVPSGSFAEDYLRLIAGNREARHAN